MAWYWIVLIICFVCFFPLGSGVYWFNVKRPQLEYEFKTLFGVLPTDEKIRVETAVKDKIGELTLKWQEVVTKFHSEGKRIDEVKKIEADCRRAERLAYRFKVEGF